MAQDGFQPAQIQAARLRTLVVLVLCFAVLPGALLLSVGILILVFGHQPHEYVFGILIVALAATLAGGIIATLSYVRRSTSLARLQAEFVQKVSHDLRTPLTGIRLFVETLQSGKVTGAEETKECLDVIQAETERLTNMVERLLGWARMEAGKRVFRLAPGSITEIADRAISALDVDRKLGEHGVRGKLTVQRDIADGLPAVKVDAEAMIEAVLNILQNAVRFTGADKQIAVRAQVIGREVWLTVRDNGPGIAKEEQGKIFEKFYRAVDPANPHVEGSGLGLAIVHQIVRAHAGRVSVDSDLGRGAAFTIALPLPDEHLATATAQPLAEGARSS